MLTSIWQPSLNENAGDDPESFDIEHIRVAQQADAIVIAPATANIIAKLAHGLADDLLTTICLATTAPIFLAPAMNVNMWRNPATQANLSTLRSRGIRIVEPGAGYLACGMVGEGRLADPAEIADAVLAPAKRDLAGQTVLITAGGTREPIDPVRFLGNRSSGRMGFALADAALARGAEVILITAATPPAHLQHIRGETAAQMQAAVLAQLPRATIVIMAAAVADYRVASPAPHKLKKQDTLSLELTRNEDILQQIVAHRRPGAVVVGFAAETEHLLQEGRRKLREKGVDAIVANDVSQPGSGIDSDQNAGYLLTPDAEIVLPLSSKREMAERIFDFLVTTRRELATPSFCP